MTDGLEYVRCPLCQSDDATQRHAVRDHLFAQPDEFTLYACNRCGLTYLNPRPTMEAIGRFYPKDYFCYAPLLGPRTDARAGMSGLTKALSLQRIGQLEHHVGRVPESGHILDVGCGANAFLYHLHRLRGCRTLGLDFNAAVAQAIRDKLGMPAVAGPLIGSKLESQAFDGVAMYEYLEHEGQPLEVLAEAHRVTKPGGWLVIETPNVASGLALLFGCKWCQLDTPRHLVLFEPRTVRQTLERSGYEVIAIRPLCYQWMLGFSILVAAGFRNMGRLGPVELLGVLATLPFLPVPWLFPEFMRSHAVPC